MATNKLNTKKIWHISTWLSLKNFYYFSGKILPYLAVLFLVTFIAGTIGGLFFAPADYQQGEIFRIIYVHVPAAFLSLFVYTIIFVNSVVFLIWRVKLADILASHSASLGASFTFLALFTGALWGKPMWGTFWVWDARLTSELILLFLYFGYMGLRSAMPNAEGRAKISALFAVIGMIDIPIVHFSVNWWQTLHQGATLSKFARPSIATEMLIPLLLMIISFLIFYIFILVFRSRTEIIMREKKSYWVQNEFNPPERDTSTAFTPATPYANSTPSCSTPSARSTPFDPGIISHE